MKRRPIDQVACRVGLRWQLCETLSAMLEAELCILRAYCITVRVVSLVAWEIASRIWLRETLCGPSRAGCTPIAVTY